MQSGSLSSKPVLQRDAGVTAGPCMHLGFVSRRTMDNQAFQAKCMAAAARDGFRNVCHLGEGRDGLIYLMLPEHISANDVHDTGISKAISCVKVPANTIAADDLRREIEVYKGLSSLPHCIPYAPALIALNEGTHPYLAIEALHGTTIGCVKRTAIWVPTVLVWSVLTDLLQAVLDLRHSPLGLIHSDLHEENIMLTYSESQTSLPKAMIIDFGRSKSVLDPHKVSTQVYNADLVYISMAIRGLCTICDSNDTLVTWLDADWKLIITSCDIRRGTPILHDELASLAALARRRRDEELLKSEPIPASYWMELLQSKPLVPTDNLRAVRESMRVKMKTEGDPMDTSPG